MVYAEHVTDAIGYIRVSTEEQADSRAGLDAQRAAILAEAQRRGWHLVEVIEDAGFSGKDLNRPGIVAALEALRRHKADTLVVAKLDRLSRSMLDFSILLRRALLEHWALVALDIGVDTTTASGELYANMLVTFAQFERRRMGERTRDALAEKRKSGVTLGRPRTMPEAVVARIRAERAAGRTLSAIADGLSSDAVPTAQGGRRWYPSTVRKALAGPADGAEGHTRERWRGQGDLLP
jgi:DNA invertase Pin-like site-specific DNA recombinase